MPSLIHTTRHKQRFEFDTGRIDAWRISIIIPGMERYVPKDITCFGALQKLSIAHTLQKVYADFVEVYNITGKAIDDQTFTIIEKIADTYNDDAEEAELWFTYLYAAMIAEEKKEGSKLGKRIKRLGIHQLLIDGFSPDKAATFSKGKTVPVLDPLMVAKGF